jgi:hypothetical protein
VSVIRSQIESPQRHFTETYRPSFVSCLRLLFDPNDGGEITTRITPERMTETVMHMRQIKNIKYAVKRVGIHILHRSKWLSLQQTMQQGGTGNRIRNPG